MEKPESDVNCRKKTKTNKTCSSESLENIVSGKLL